MDFSDYYVVPAAYRAEVEQLFEPIRITDHGKFVSVITGDRTRFATVPVAMHFHNDEWAAWGFTVFVNGQQLAHGLFGENAETGVSVEDNVLEGDLDEAARLLDVPKLKFHEALATEDVETFANVVDVPLMSITPGVLERELGSDTMMKSLIAPVAQVAKQPAKQPARKPSARKPSAKQTAAKKAAKPAKKRSAKQPTQRARQPKKQAKQPAKQRAKARQR